MGKSRSQRLEFSWTTRSVAFLSQTESCCIGLHLEQEGHSPACPLLQGADTSSCPRAQLGLTWPEDIPAHKGSSGDRTGKLKGNHSLQETEKKKKKIAVVNSWNVIP